MSSANDTIELALGSDLEHVPLVQLAVEGITALMGFDQETSFRIRLSVCESVINAIKHGNRYNPAKKVTVRFQLEKEQLVVSICDEGDGFSPDQILDPSVPENLDRPNGRGILLKKSFMDEVHFTRRAEGGMMVRLVKRLVP